MDKYTAKIVRKIVISLAATLLCGQAFATYNNFKIYIYNASQQTFILGFGSAGMTNLNGTSGALGYVWSDGNQGQSQAVLPPGAYATFYAGTNLYGDPSSVVITGLNGIMFQLWTGGFTALPGGGTPMNYAWHGISLTDGSGNDPYNGASPFGLGVAVAPGAGGSVDCTKVNVPLAGWGTGFTNGTDANASSFNQLLSGSWGNSPSPLCMKWASNPSNGYIGGNNWVITVEYDLWSLYIVIPPDFPAPRSAPTMSGN